MASGKPLTRFEPLSPHHLKYSLLTCCESSALDHAATEGIVSVCDQPRPLMVQAVYDMFDLEPVSADLGDSPSCRFIFIGSIPGMVVNRQLVDWVGSVSLLSSVISWSQDSNHGRIN
uniref:Uncharacterized protein n=1 Tax=Timema poppense TaxID=170557 RepID=A0A7R9CYK6_TIMPO|nr:unnamed protein product [Timema poppensis]